MTQIRVYLPLTHADVQSLTTGASVTPRAAYAVTAALRTTLAGADEEEREYAALKDAVAAAAALCDGIGGASGKRIVAAADVDPANVDAVSGPDPEVASAVSVTAAVPLRRIVSFHVDESTDTAYDDELLWYDVTELDEVARLTR